MYKVGKTFRYRDKDYPNGAPCILYDGDSVLCVFPSMMYGEQQAHVVCELLNNARENAVNLQKYC